MNNFEFSPQAMALVSQKDFKGIDTNSVNLIVNDLVKQISEFIPKKANISLIKLNALSVFADEELRKVSSPAQLVGCIIHAATLDLSLSKINDQVYLINFKGKLKFKITRRGLVLLAHRTGNVKNTFRGTVYKGDDFIYQNENGVFYWHHKAVAKIKNPNLTNEDITHCYFGITHTNGFTYFSCLMRSELERLRKTGSSNGTEPSGAWLHYSSMGETKAAYKALLDFYFGLDAKEMILIDGKIEENVLSVSYESVYDNEENETIVTEQTETEAEIIEKLKSFSTIKEITDFGLEIKPVGNLRKAFSEQYKKIIAENAVDISVEEIKAKIDSFVTIEELTNYVKSIALKEENELYAYAMQVRKKIRALLVEKQIFLEEWFSASNLTFEQVELIPERFNEKFNTHLALEPNLLTTYTNFVSFFKAKQNV